jgi:2-iminobutanoate/2-iminopropanoate deaminase
MRMSLVLALGAALLAAGCRPSDEDVRRIVREEMHSAMERQSITSKNVIGPYSPAVRVGGFLFVSGQIALDPQTGALKQESIEVETRQALDNLMGILRAQGYDSSNVVSATVYLKSIKDYAAVNQVYAGYFSQGNYPARVAVEVAALPKQANIEIAAIAYRSR